MDREWDGEWLKVQVEFYAAKKMRDATRQSIDLRPMARAAEIIRLADRRFDDAEARRDTFIAERKRSEPAWSETD